MLYAQIKENLLFPMLRRAAGYTATPLAALGASSGQIEDAQAALILVFGIGFDLLVSNLNRTALVKKVKKEVFR